MTSPLASDDAACAAALSDLPAMGPAQLARLLDRQGPQEAWRSVLAGQVERPAGRPGRARVPWAVAAARIDPRVRWTPMERSGVRVTWRGHPDYPETLVNDPEPPGVLFWRGDLRCLDRPCVAIVGTRHATADGRRSAFEMGRDLADAGICVVSGLALGIDGAAHSGVLHALAARPGAGAGPLGVAASSVDVPYPRRHAQLWEQVAKGGVMVSETPPGRPAQAWRFPTRNRIIAGLSQLVVVVESHIRGGSLITAEAALARGIEVRAVPGPVHSDASAGSNQLLYDGPGPVRHAQDVLDAIGMFRSTAPESPSPTRSALPRPGSDPARVLGELSWTPVTAGRVMTRTGLDPAAVERALDELRSLSLVREEAGWWCRI